jgi:hypothetical protein
MEREEGSRVLRVYDQGRREVDGDGEGEDLR